MTIDSFEQDMIRKNTRAARIIWMINVVTSVIIFLVFSNLQFTKINNEPYVHYVLGALAIGELIVIIVMRRIRLKPAVLKKLIERGGGEVARNFFFMDIISLALSDSVLIYGVVGYIITGDFEIMKMFAYVTALALIYFFPRENARIKQCQDAFTVQ